MRLDAFRPLPATFVRKIQEQMQLEYIYNSNSIEGNTLTLRETQLVLEEGITVGGKPLREILEVKNHPEAITYVERLASGNELKETDILTLHQILMKDILGGAGRYRTAEVRIKGSTHIPAPAYEIPFKIRDMLETYNRNPNELLPIEMAARLHHQLVHIHPFHDGNGRIARLLMNLTLLHYGYPMTIILRADRKRYYNSLQIADRGNLIPFTNFIGSNVEQALDLHLRAIEPTRDALLPISEAAKGTPYSAEYLSLLARKGRISATKTGKKWLISKQTIQRYLQEQKKSGRKRR